MPTDEQVAIRETIPELQKRIAKLEKRMDAASKLLTVLKGKKAGK